MHNSQSHQPFEILGVDPGFSGAVASLNIISGSIVHLYPMPITYKRIGTGHRPEIDTNVLHNYLLMIRQNCSTMVLEKVTASPQMGVTSAFRFGEGYGIILGIAEALAFRIIHANPSVWKSAMNLSRDKNASLKLAAQYWPSHEKTWKYKKNDGLAEAGLLAEFGRRSLSLVDETSNFDDLL